MALSPGSDRAAEGHDRGLGVEGGRRSAPRAVYGGWASPSPSPMSAPNTSLTQARIDGHRPEVLAQVDDAVAEARSARAVQSAMSAPPEAVDRLLRVADEEELAPARARRRPSVPAAASGRRRRGRRRSRPGAGRCPGTRRRGGRRSGRARASRTVGVGPEQVAGEHEEVVVVQPPAAGARRPRRGRSVRRRCGQDARAPRCGAARHAARPVRPSAALERGVDLGLGLARPPGCPLSAAALRHGPGAVSERLGRPPARRRWPASS